MTSNNNNSMEKMAVIGVDNADDLVDCTSVIFGSD